MERLWSPWRSQYIASFADEKKGEKKQCAMCEAYKANDDDARLIVWREHYNFIVMNLYPYNSGHVMVVPYLHTGNFQELPDETLSETMELLKRLSAIMKKELNADGCNIGCNIGRVAGAGIDNHIHFHIVPRWSGDTNFFPVLTDTKVISEEMKDTMLKLRRAFGV